MSRRQVEAMVAALGGGWNAARWLLLDAAIA
jgi:hypothetical protein